MPTWMASRQETKTSYKKKSWRFTSKRPATNDLVQDYDYSNVFLINDSRAARESPTSDSEFFQFWKSAVFLLKYNIQYHDLHISEFLQNNILV